MIDDIIEWSFPVVFGAMLLVLFVLVPIGAYQEASLSQTCLEAGYPKSHYFVFGPSFCSGYDGVLRPVIEVAK